MPVAACCDVFYYSLGREDATAPPEVVRGACRLVADCFMHPKLDLARFLGLFVAVDSASGDERLGVCFLEPASQFLPSSVCDPRSFFVSALCVGKQHRGRGVGSRLLEAALGRGDPLLLYVNRYDGDELPLVQWYERNGFRVFPRAKTKFVPYDDNAEVLMLGHTVSHVLESCI